VLSRYFQDPCNDSKLLSHGADKDMVDNNLCIAAFGRYNCSLSNLEHDGAVTQVQQLLEPTVRAPALLANHALSTVSSDSNCMDEYKLTTDEDIALFDWLLTS
jgi:hypothetical protein